MFHPGRGIFAYVCSKFSHKNAPCEMPTCISIAQARTTRGSQFWSGAFNHCKFSSSEVSMCMSTAQAHTECGPKFASHSFFVAGAIIFRPRQKLGRKSQPSALCVGQIALVVARF